MKPIITSSKASEQIITEYDVEVTGLEKPIQLKVVVGAAGNILSDLSKIIDAYTWIDLTQHDREEILRSLIDHFKTKN